MAILSEHDKHTVVILLARFESPAAVAVQMRELYGVNTDRFQVRTYDPTCNRYEAGQRWQSVFWGERDRYLNELSEVPIAHKAYRLAMLQRILDRAMHDGNFRLAKATLRQAAEEVGDSLTNERKVQVSTPLDGLSSSERRARFAEIVREVSKRMVPLDPSLPQEETS